MAESEARHRVRREVPEDEPADPAVRALRSDAEKRREMVWAEYNPEGWSA